MQFKCNPKDSAKRMDKRELIFYEIPQVIIHPHISIRVPKLEDKFHSILTHSTFGICHYEPRNAKLDKTIQKNK